MVEKQVEIEVLAVDNHPLLSLDEGEAIAQLQYKLLQMRHKTVLEALFAVHPFQPCELQEIRAFEDKVRGENVVFPQFRQLLFD